MRKIAITGTHGVGKTTLAHQLCVCLKERQINTVVIEEKARACPFPLNESASVDTEIWMVHSQIRAELDAKARRYDVAITDRCSLDAIVYWNDRNLKSPYFNLLEKASIQWAEHEYEHIILVEPSSDTDFFAVDAVRDSGISYRNRIRDLFRTYLDQLSFESRQKIIYVQSDEIFQSQRYSLAVQKIMEKIQWDALVPC